LPEVHKILDVGVGTGIFYSVFQNRGRYEIQGVEILADFQETLTSRGIQSKIADINSQALPYADAEFDLVICDSLIEHSLNPRHVVSELMRVLKPGKFLILATPNAMSARAKLNYIRGRNPFWPLIDNLYSRVYLQRCSIFYSIKEISHILPKEMSIQEIIYQDETYTDPHTLSVFFCRIISSLFPKLRDLLVVVIKRIPA
jgi:ubiquinone/menaquinone biosynthesis C-methylase UbiE